MNNMITDNGGIGIDGNNAAVAIFAAFNRLRDNVGGHTNLATEWLAATSIGHVTTDTGGPETDYVDAGNNDYNLLGDSPGTSVGRPLNASIGALQRSQIVDPTLDLLIDDVAAIRAKTDQMTFTANKVDVNVAYLVGVALTTTGSQVADRFSEFFDESSAGHTVASGTLNATSIRDAVGLADPDLDDQLTAINDDTAETNAGVAELTTGVVIASGGLTESAFAADTAKYQAKVWLQDDDSTVTPADRYIVAWFKNGEPLFAGITDATLQVIKSSDGSNLLAATPMTEIASTGIYKYDSSVARINNGLGYIAIATATIDGETRTWPQPIGRDS